jgi:hypothetical protein
MLRFLFLRRLDRNVRTTLKSDAPWSFADSIAFGPPDASFGTHVHDIIK